MVEDAANNGWMDSYSTPPLPLTIFRRIRQHCLTNSCLSNHVHQSKKMKEGIMRKEQKIAEIDEMSKTKTEKEINWIKVAKGNQKSEEGGSLNTLTMNN